MWHRCITIWQTIYEDTLSFIKDKGTELYQKDRLDFSQDRYQKALGYLKDMEPATDLAGELAARYR